VERIYEHGRKQGFHPKTPEAPLFCMWYRKSRGEFVMLAENQFSSVSPGLKQEMTDMFENFK